MTALTAVAVGSTALPLHLPLDVRVVILATGVQVFLVAVDVPPAGVSRSVRWAVPLLGHGATLTASALVLEVGPFEPGAAVLAYAAGFSLLALHAFWMRQLANGEAPRPDTMSRWEAVLLVALIAGVSGAVAASFAVRAGQPVLSAPVARSGLLVSGVAAVVSVATLAAPPSLPSALDALTGTVTTVFEHATAFVILLNSLLLSVLLVSSGGFFWVIGVYFAWLALGVLLEYLAVVHAYRTYDETPPAPPSLSPDAPVTVVVAAAGEAEVLPESLAQNLSALGNLPFVVVPATSPDDGTVEVAREFEADDPERVSVVEGTTGSKAGDLNLAWSHVETPYALILDADETVGPEFVARGLRVLRERPEVGVVQGRKAAARPDAGVLSRFISAERRHSTWLDHPFVNDVFGAGHFAGSAAMFRREVPPAVDGWRPEVLTEDIDFTLRLYVHTDWLVEYVPEMVARESHPASLQALVRQRVRWARGWAQVAVLHLRDLVGSRRKLGWRRTLGMAWLLLNAVGAPISTVFPAFVLLWYVGVAPALPLYVVVPFALVILPARAVSFGYASFRDPAISTPATPARAAEVVVYAYLWVLFGWFIQLHALYLQFAGAPRSWYVTKKAGAATG